MNYATVWHGIYINIWRSLSLIFSHKCHIFFILKLFLINIQTFSFPIIKIQQLKKSIIIISIISLFPSLLNVSLISQEISFSRLNLQLLVLSISHLPLLNGHVCFLSIYVMLECFYLIIDYSNWLLYFKINQTKIVSSKKLNLLT